eukprot:1159522-Pelagomonas_calceolata.AAC.5
MEGLMLASPRAGTAGGGLALPDGPAGFCARGWGGRTGCCAHWAPPSVRQGRPACASVQGMEWNGKCGCR